jgi:hypothetical protein
VSDAGTIGVPQTRVADLFASLDNLDRLKIDAEGFELPIFCSIAKQLQWLKPSNTVRGPYRGGSAAGGIGSLLPGYRIFGIDKGLLKTHLRPIHWRDDCQFNDYVPLIS